MIDGLHACGTKGEHGAGGTRKGAGRSSSITRKGTGAENIHTPDAFHPTLTEINFFLYRVNRLQRLLWSRHTDQLKRTLKLYWAPTHAMTEICTFWQRYQGTPIFGRKRQFSKERDSLTQFRRNITLFLYKKKTCLYLGPGAESHWLTEDEAKDNSFTPLRLDVFHAM